jgi:hypothetical protein
MFLTKNGRKQGGVSSPLLWNMSLVTIEKAWEHKTQMDTPASVLCNLLV